MSAQALKLIAEERQARTGRLDIGCCGLRELPEELFELVWLEELVLSNEWVDWEKQKWVESANKGENNEFKAMPAELAKLEKLQVLYCGGGHASWSIKDLSVIGNLKALRVLYLDRTNANDYGFLAQLTSLSSLDLSSNQLTEISALTRLTSLSYLDLSSNQITEISALTTLTSLSSLYLRDNQITEISALTTLTALTSLSLSSNQITDISVLASLRALTSLSLRDNQITDISVLASLRALTSLSLSYNKITDISALTRLTSLSSLSLSSNQITEISALTGLTKLKELALQHNKLVEVTALLPLIERGMKLDAEKDHWLQISQGDISLKGNPLETPPLQIIQQGNEAVINYFKQLEAEQNQQKQLYEAKLLVIGAAGAGKTTFFRRIQEAKAPMPEQKDTTHGIEVGRWLFDFEEQGQEERFHANLWDFGGQKVFYGTHQFFFSEKSLYVLLCDTRRQDTDFSYWLNTVEQLGGESSALLILGNQREGYQLHLDELGYRSRYGALIQEVLTQDLKKVKDIPALQGKVKELMQRLPDVGVKLIASWVDIREALAEIKKPYISYPAFIDLCERHGQTDPENIEYISRYFHRIGAFTHFLDDPILRERVYLDSNWLTQTVYAFLENPLVKERAGRLSRADINAVLKAKDLHHEIPSLLALMERFGQMYDASKNSKASKNSFIIPTHLPEQKPYLRWAQEGKGEILHYRYYFDKYMPHGLMPRLIVALHDYIPDHDKVWKKGVNLSYRNAEAEVVQLYGGTNIFDIRIVGAYRRDLLVIITQAFDKILSDFKKPSHEKKLRCPCNKCAGDTNKAHFFSTKTIESALINKLPNTPDPTIECNHSWKSIPILKLLGLADTESIIARVQPHFMKEMEQRLGDKLDSHRQRFEQFVVATEQEHKIILHYQGDLQRGISAANDKLDRLTTYLQKMEAKIPAGLWEEYAAVKAKVEGNQDDQQDLQEWFEHLEKISIDLAQQIPRATAEELKRLTQKAKGEVKLKNKLKWVLPLMVGDAFGIRYEGELEVSVDVREHWGRLKRYLGVKGA